MCRNLCAWTYRIAVGLSPLICFSASLFYTTTGVTDCSNLSCCKTEGSGGDEGEEEDEEGDDDDGLESEDEEEEG